MRLGPEDLDVSPLYLMPPAFAVRSHSVWAEIAPEITRAELNFPERMDVSFLRLLHRVRLLAGVPFRFVSDARDPARNAAAGGASRSAHMEEPCRAVDLHVVNSFERGRIVVAAVMLGFRRIGVYPAKADGAGSLHLDASVANPSPRLWTRY